jgi:rRNA-processing protein FCF1
LRELRRLVSRDRTRAAARSALGLVMDRFSIAEARGGADDSVVDLARTYGYAVATCDMDLARRCRALGLRVIHFRSGSRRVMGSWE